MGQCKDYGETPEDIEGEINSLKAASVISTLETHLCRQLQKEEKEERSKGCKRYIDRYLTNSTIIKPSDIFAPLLDLAEHARQELPP